MFELIKRVFSRVKTIRDETKFYKYKKLNIGVGTQYSLENLDGIAPQLITIGNDCVIAPKAVILTHDACLLPTTGRYIFKRVEIGSRVFIGYGAVIMPGITIGNDVIVGSNCVVTKDIPSNTVVVGVPARAIGKTSDLGARLETELIKPVFDWRKPISARDIIKQQLILLTLISKEKN
ncbi:TPA: acyltransferase [Aeromonas veronii]